MRVLLDVGACAGQSLAAALDPAYRFDRIVCFEPVSFCWPLLARLADDRVSVERFGLWHCTGRYPVFEPGRKGAGLWKKDAYHPRPWSETPELCEFRRASDWFAENIAPTDRVWLKLNCEGAECDILDDLLDSGEFEKVSHALVFFDAHKIRALKHREAEVKARLAAYPHPRVMYRETVAGATAGERLRHWLALCP